MASFAADQSGVVEVALAPGENVYSHETDAWDAELVDLFREVQRGMPATAIRKVDGTKGDPIAIGQVIVDIVTSGAAIALIGCIKAWIDARPGKRQLKLRWRKGDGDTTLTVDANNIDDDVMKAALTEALKHGS
jgi:hypothetical protein